MRGRKTQRPKEEGPSRSDRVEDRSDVADAIRELRELRRDVRLGGLDWKRLRDEGRP